MPGFQNRPANTFRRANSIGRGSMPGSRAPRRSDEEQAVQNAPTSMGSASSGMPQGLPPMPGQLPGGGPPPPGGVPTSSPPGTPPSPSGSAPQSAAQLLSPNASAQGPGQMVPRAQSSAAQMQPPTLESLQNVPGIGLPLDHNIGQGASSNNIGRGAGSTLGEFWGLPGPSTPQPDQAPGLSGWTRAGAHDVGMYDPNATHSTRQKDVEQARSVDGGMDEKPEWQQQFDLMWEEFNKGRDAAMDQTYMDEARAGRGMAAINAMKTGSLGGGFGGGVGSVAQGGMRARMQAQQEWAEKGMELRMAYLDRLYADAEREDNQEMMEWVENERNQTARDVASLQAEAQADLDEAQDEERAEHLSDLVEDDMATDSEKREHYANEIMDEYGFQDQEWAEEVYDWVWDLDPHTLKYLENHPDEMEQLMRYLATHPDIDLDNMSVNIGG